MTFETVDLLQITHINSKITKAWLCFQKIYQSKLIYYSPYVSHKLLQTALENEYNITCNEDILRKRLKEIAQSTFSNTHVQEYITLQTMVTATRKICSFFNFGLILKTFKMNFNVWPDLENFRVDPPFYLSLLQALNM